MPGDDFAAGRHGEMEVRGTKYEVKELGTTELCRGVERRQSRNDARRINQGTREVEAPLVCGASVTHMGTSIAAFFENFIGTGVIPYTAIRSPHTPVTGMKYGVRSTG